VSIQSRLLQFRYFFTRKLFFLREAMPLVVLQEALAPFDELFEIPHADQTGAASPISPGCCWLRRGIPFWEWVWQSAALLIFKTVA